MSREDKVYQQAIEQVSKIKHFYQFLLKGLLLCVALMLINVVTSPEYMWSLWVLVAWLVIASLKWVSTFGFGALFDRNWEKKQVEKRLSQLSE
ncbi:2TM domain-containing protein [Pseudoalteromonas sp. MMG012]|uniref:2TM domain-containing protein n=1 Tax=Pseudoalteromonas sp. MMG012 TaxID=2822686 RepID=UPI001B3A0685|nr:2TM domain-containing protein [Pseudoalteromonas sp. MMG012]MBQ4850000.1 2TM domain-containing protein [Pseudoalteromonas sp. MMG012]